MNTKFIQSIAGIFIFILVLFSSQVAKAEYSSGGNGYNNPTTVGEFNFTAVLKDGAVHMKWTPYVTEGFNYYKVVRSNSNPNPVYPDDGYIKYSGETGFASYVDYDTPQGTSYYRICSIAKPNRYCSKVIKIYKEGSSDSYSADTTKSKDDNGYYSPSVVSDFNFTAILDNGAVHMKWTPYVTEGFNYYKVVRSNSNPNPVYPDDGYIKYSGETGFASYVDYDTPQGTSYYRICSIASPNRYCSKVITITNNSDNSYKKDYKEYKKAEDYKKPKNYYKKPPKIKKEIKKPVKIKEESFEDIENYYEKEEPSYSRGSSRKRGGLMKLLFELLFGY